MGLSSNARLLSITARITSNEYEAQKIANSKMRLSTQSQQASRDYINALDANKLMFMSYDAQGNPINADLTASLLYQYGDSKSQYALSNPAGQLLIKVEDKNAFESAPNLEAFLKKYGIEKTWKTEKLAQLSEELASFSEAKENWEKILNNKRVELYSGSYTDVSEDGKISKKEYSKRDAVTAWEYEKSGKYNDYVIAYNEYDNKLSKIINNDETVSENEIQEAYQKQSNLYAEYTSYVTFDAWIEMKAKAENSEEYNEYQKYLDKAAEFNAEIEKYETVNEAYSYSDSPKAQWYTNLWYRLNGESSEKNENSKYNYQVIDANLLTSSSWLRDALAQGSVIIESASYTKTADQIPDLKEPDIVNLKGIKWESKIYSSCPDITTEDDKAAIAKAEAEYEQKTKDITAKEKKFDNKIRTLQTEHDALTEEYNSVKSALESNIKRSFNIFNS